MEKLKIMSGNIDGINGAFLRGFPEIINKTQPDIICVQEVKIPEKKIKDKVRNLPGYKSNFYTPLRGKKSGVGLYSKIHPKMQLWGLGLEEGMEGRTILAEFPKFTLINSYAPSGRKHEDLKHKYQYIENLFQYAQKLHQEGKNIILCGDFNVAYSQKEAYNPEYYGPGYLNEEKILFKKFLKSGFIDTYRIFHPKTKHFTWRSRRLREYNLEGGFKLDYIFTNKELEDNLTDAYIRDYELSDHDQLFLELEI